MGAVADAALAAGGEVIGVIPRGLVDRELAHPGLTELRVVETLHERKARDGRPVRRRSSRCPAASARSRSWPRSRRGPSSSSTPSRSACSDIGGYWDAAAGLARPCRRRGVRRPGPSRALVTLDPDPRGAPRRVRGVAGRRPAAGRRGSSLRGLGDGFGVGHGCGSPPGGREEPARRRPGSRARSGPATSRSGYRPTHQRVADDHPDDAARADLVEIAASSGRRSAGTSVRIELPTASSSVGSCQNRLPPVGRSSEATMISCWRAARVKSLSPPPLRTRA